MCVVTHMFESPITTIRGEMNPTRSKHRADQACNMVTIKYYPPTRPTELRCCAGAAVRDGMVIGIHATAHLFGACLRMGGCGRTKPPETVPSLVNSPAETARTKLKGKTAQKRK